MSFNNNHINITESNYQEYFILYVDNELTPQERSAVEAFVVMHPAYAAELDVLLSTCLPVEDVKLPQIESLLAHNIKKTVAEEDLLLYLDNELSKDEAATIELKLRTDADFNEQYKLLQKAKVPTEQVVYPYKQQLLRSTERRVGSAAWLRIAAAFVIILFASILYTTQQSIITEQPGTAGHNLPTVPYNEPGISNEVDDAVMPAPVPEHNAVVANAQTDATPQTLITAKVPTENAVKVKIEKQPGALMAVHKQQQTVEHNTPQQVQISVPEEAENAIAFAITNDHKKVAKKQSEAVTIEPGNTYNNTTPPMQAAPQYAAVMQSSDDNNSKTGLKVFLRKATRFIERTTNISATNEDDELLVGALTVKL